MLRFRNLLPAVAALVGAAVLGAPAKARADFELKITTTSGFSTIIHDDGAGDLDPTTPGHIVFSGAAGANFKITLVGSLSKPASGSAANPDMDVTFQVTSTTGAADTITIQASDTDFGPTQAGSGPMMIGGTLIAGATVTYQTFQDTGNADFGSTSASPVLTFPPPSSGAYSGSSSLHYDADSNYSLTQKITVAYAAGAKGTTSGDADLKGVPAPAGLLLALGGMPVLALGAYLRRRRTPAAA